MKTFASSFEFVGAIFRWRTPAFLRHLKMAPTAILLLLTFLTLTGGDAQEPMASIRWVTVTPHMFTDVGDGAEVNLKVTFFEPAPRDGEITFTIIPTALTPGEAIWADGSSEQKLPYRRESLSVEFFTKLLVLRTGTIMIRAISAEDPQNPVDYWMDVERRQP
jgi:hypothetical protein